MRRKETLMTYTVAFIVLIAAISAGTLVIATENQIVAQAITTVTAVVGAFAIWFQMRKGKRLNEGEFIVGLNKQFIENKHIYDLFLKMEKYERTDKKSHDFTEDDIANVAAYMTFFEVIYSLIQRKIIELWMIDDLFSYQFFLLLNNEHIQNLELLPCQDFYIDVFRLYRMWKKYRLKLSKKILNERNCILNKITIDLDENHDHKKK
jgi:hypothetical protein